MPCVSVEDVDRNRAVPGENVHRNPAFLVENVDRNRAFLVENVERNRVVLVECQPKSSFAGGMSTAIELFRCFYGNMGNDMKLRD